MSSTDVTTPPDITALGELADHLTAILDHLDQHPARVLELDMHARYDFRVLEEMWDVKKTLPTQERDAELIKLMTLYNNEITRRPLDTEDVCEVRAIVGEVAETARVALCEIVPEKTGVLGELPVEIRRLMGKWMNLAERIRMRTWR